MSDLPTKLRNAALLIHDGHDPLEARDVMYEVAREIERGEKASRESMVPSIEAALFGTEDGDLLHDEDATVPVGEYRRLLWDVWARRGQRAS